MNRFGMVAAGVLLFLVSWHQDSLVILQYAAIWLVGAAIAIQMRPSIGRIIADQRAPTLAELGTLLAGLVLAFIALGALDGLLMASRTMTMPSYSRTDTAARRLNELVSTLIAVAWTLIAVAPGLRAMLRRSGEGAPLWPVLAGIAASVPIAAGLYLLWSPFDHALLYGARLFGDAIERAMALPLLALLFGPGLFLWLRAWRGGLRFEVEGILGATIRAVAVAWAVLGAAAIFGFVTALNRDWSTDPGAVTCLILAPIAVAWVGGLWRLFGAEQCGPIRAALGWAVLGAGYLLSIALPSQTVNAGGWASLMLLLGLPLIIAAMLVATLLAPWLLRRLIRGGEQKPGFA
jgi:hypothetical protein